VACDSPVLKFWNLIISRACAELQAAASKGSVNFKRMNQRSDLRAALYIKAVFSDVLHVAAVGLCVPRG
jgi:hypothetical protein